MSDSLEIPSTACFTYIVSGDDQVISKQQNLKASAEQVILSLCGTTLSKMITEQEVGHLNSIIIHFHPEILNTI